MWLAPKGDSGAKGNTGSTGAQGPKGDTEATGPGGNNGTNGLTTSVNGITQVDGAITLTKAAIGLGNVDNTSDLIKFTSPTLTGTPTAPSAISGINTTQIATTAFVTNAVAATTHAISDSYGGGIVFYVTPNGTHSLVAATQDQSIVTTSWYEAQNAISTSANHNAAGQAFTDWRLPTKNELDLLYKQKSVVGSFNESPVVVGNLFVSCYWSSTEKDVGDAWTKRFYDAAYVFIDKSEPHRVRAVRAF